jgi:hypothetical protein
MEQQRLQAIEALEISDNSVKCHRCGLDIPMDGKLSRPQNDRVAILQKMIKWMENYYHDANIDDLTALKQQLAELLEDAKYDRLRSLPRIAAELLVGSLYVPSSKARVLKK